MHNLTDNYNRIHDYLRISLTDKCNLNCIYCNPLGSKSSKLNKNEILSFDELLRVIDIFAGKLGTKKIRFTGGEPLVRKDVIQFFKSVHNLKKKYGFEVGLTTNGTLLEDKLNDLKNYGIDKLNISIDSLRPERVKYITGNDNIKSVLKSINEAYNLGFSSLKLNAVIIKNINDDELLDFVELVKDKEMNIRFIEFMPFGNNSWNKDGFISYQEMKNIIETKYILEEIIELKNLVAKNYRIKGHRGKVGFISSISNHFCESCNRLRITAEGKMKLCLFSNGQNEISFKEILAKYNDDQICNLIIDSLQYKPKQHAEVEELLRLEENNMLSIGG